MAQRSLAAVGLVLAVVTVFWAGAVAQTSGCTNTLITLAPCLTYITGNSSTPSTQCCQQLATVVQSPSSTQCLCQALSTGGSSLGINVNQTQALALPGACNVKTPPLSNCNAASPFGSPAFSPAGAPQTPIAIPGTGSQTGPSSDGSSIKLSFSLLIFLLFAASYGSIFSSC